MGPVSRLGRVRLCQGSRRTCQRFLILGSLGAHIQNILHDLPLPHVFQLLLLRHAGLQRGLLDVAAHHDV